MLKVLGNVFSLKKIKSVLWFFTILLLFSSIISFFLLFHHFISLREASIIMHEDFMEAINVVAAKKKGSLDYYA